MKKIISLMFLTGVIITCTACGSYSMKNKDNGDTSFVSENSKAHSAFTDSFYIEDYFSESPSLEYTTEEISSSLVLSQESVEDAIESTFSTEDTTESAIENEAPPSNDTSIDEPNPAPPTISDFIGKTVSDVKTKYGGSFTHDYFHGLSTMNYRDKEIAFVLGAAYQSINDKYVITGVLSYGNENAIGELNGTMTYPQIKSTIGNEINLGNPEQQYNAIDAVFEYTLQFEYNGLDIAFSWTYDPDVNFSDIVYVASQTVTPSIPEPEDNSSLETPDPESDYIGLWVHTEFGNAFTVEVTEQQGDVIKVTITAIRGEAYSIADCDGTLRLTDGKGSFEFLDSFLNSGTCYISIENGIMSVSYDLHGESLKFWGISVGAGNYTKSDN